MILNKLLARRLPLFESEIAKSEEYPHEVDWDSFVSEMFDLLCLCRKQLDDLSVCSDIMEENTVSDYKLDLNKIS